MVSPLILSHSSNPTPQYLNIRKDKRIHFHFVDFDRADPFPPSRHRRYLDPFEWIISYNLGLVHLNTGQYASAFHYFSSSINLKPDFPSSYMYLAITLSRLDDFTNSCAAYEKACEMETQDPIFQLNFAITLFNHGDLAEAKKQFLMMKENLNEEEADAEVLEMKATLEQLLV